MATVGGYPVRKLIRNCCITAFIGTTSGMTYKQLKNHPKKIKKVLIYSSVPGFTGLLLGGCYGYLSRKTIFFSGLKGAGNFYFMSCSFLGINEALRVSEIVKNELEYSNKHRFVETTVSGVITGVIVGYFWWVNPINIFTTATAFGAITGTGQLVIDKAEKWRVQRAVLLRYPELVELEWHALDESEQEIIRQKNKKWWDRLYEYLLDRPLAGKLRIKHQSLLEELELLAIEETELLEQLGLEQNNEEVETQIQVL